ncbi:hypothetical protein BC332_11231 [Capsicum chinense]|nr:hypothetical protein BC332_11231 [Capsicum chinense]
MLLKFGSKPVLIASSLEMAKEILKTHDAIFTSRPALAAGKYTSFNYSDITWAPYGAYWPHARKIYLTEVFNPKSLDSLEYIRIEERRILSDKYFSDHYDQSNSDASILVRLARELKRMKALGKNWTEFYKYVIEDHKSKRQTKKDFIPKDMIDVLLHLADNPNLQIKLTADNLMGLMHNFLTGGTDTSAATIEWGFQELLRIPNIIEKAHQELDRAIGKERWVEEKDFSQLPYIDAIIKETFRLHPLCALLPPHYSTEDCTVAGYDIPKGTAAYINVWSIGRNSKYWDRPEEFIPERFIENNIDMKGQNFSLLPFGSGRRRCLGYNFGIKVVRTTMADLLHGFNWKLAGNLEDISMEEIYGLTTHPKRPISMIMEPRLPLHLY